MYKQVGLAILIIAPLLADFAARHSGAPAAAAPVAVEGLPPGAVEMKGPPRGDGPPIPAPQQPMAANMLANGQMQTVPGLGAGIDPTPSLDPTPGGMSQPAPSPVAPQPVMMAPPPQFAGPPPQGMPAGMQMSPDGTMQPGPVGQPAQ